MDQLIDQLKVLVWKVMHFRWLALSTLVLVSVIGWAIVWFIPNQYEVKAQVYVDTQSVLKPLLRGLAVDSSAQEQAALLMKRSLLSRPNLEKIILETDLDLTVTDELGMERLIRRLSFDILVQGHADKRRSDTNIYTVTYSNSDKRMAFKVVDAVLNIFLENTLGLTRQDSSGATTFLNRQIDEYRVRLDAADEAIKEFNIKYSDVLPNEKMGFYQRLSQAEAQHQEASLLRKEALYRVEQLETQISQIDEKIALAESQSRGLSFANRISDLELRLSELRLQYTDDHPDVIAARAAIEELRETSKKLEDEGNSSSNQVLVDNPVYQELNILLSQAKAELAVTDARVEEYANRAKQLRSKIEVIPQIEAEYTALVRDYDVTLKTYQELVQRRESAAISSEADKSGDTVQFRIIEPPVLPITPVSPNRPMLTAGVFLASIGLSIALAIGFAQLRGAIYSKDELTRLFALPVLGEVSMKWSHSQIGSRKKDIIIFASVVLIILALFLSLISYQLSITELNIG